MLKKLSLIFAFSFLFNLLVWIPGTSAEPMPIRAKYEASKTLEATQITLDSRNNEFTSEQINTDFDFNSIALQWDEELSENANLNLELRFYNGRWSKWYHLDASIDKKSHRDQHSAFISTAPSQAFQYRLNLKTDGFYGQAKLENLELTYFNANPSPASVISNDLLAATSFKSKAKVITRKQWGADESLRVQKAKPKEVNTDDDETKESEFEKKFAKELKIVRTITKNSKGQKLTWPLEYPENVKKIIIHHTATTNEALVASTGSTQKQNYRQIVNNIYRYHAVTRGWGDVGYHYIIDPEGRIYEGRYGEAIAAHAAGYNTGSLGIAVIGNYEENEVPKKVIDAIVKITAEKTRKFRIRPDGKSSFRGEKSHNILGHRDVNATTCPGGNLYKGLPQIRKLVASANSSNLSNAPFEFENVSKIYDLDMNRNEVKRVTIKLKNVGKNTWGKGTYLTLDQDSKNKTLLDFVGKSGIKLATMKETSVKKGKTATFTFKVKSKDLSGIAELGLTPFVKSGNRSYKINHKVYLPVFVSEPVYNYKVVKKKYPPDTIKANKNIIAWIELKNTGNVAWKRNGNTVSLGTENPRDRLSPFATRKPFARIGSLRDAIVEPGETGRFYFNIKAPSVGGLYTEHFTPVVEGIEWMENKKLKFTTYVYEKDFEGLITDLEGDKEIPKQGTGEVVFTLKNVGGKTWKKSGPSALKIQTSANNGVRVTDVDIPKKDVKPGGSIEVALTLSANALAKNGMLKIQPKIGSNNLLKTVSKRFFYKVVGGSKLKGKTKSKSSKISKTSGKSTAHSTDPEDIRIKISFNENPTISSNKGMYLYSGDKKIATYRSNEKVAVTYKSGAYRIKKGSSSRSTSKPPRFVAKSGGIIEITNMERRPSWNPDLNDNKFRGLIEVRLDSGMLVSINELPLEDYLKGLAENTNAEPIEKIKALIVAARTYAKYYMEVDEKFPGKPWHLDDNPDISQKYLGYGYELRGSKTVEAVKATKDEVITYRGKLIKTPYFSQSAGKTFSAKQVWGWTTTPYLQSVSDKYCKADELRGHGVGLSGCGARGLAKAGKNYEEILKYFYTGVKVQ